MSDTTIDTEKQITGLRQRPKRADARRNYEALLTAAADAFTENGTAASLEDIARRAEVGIGTLYRNFPNRQALLEAVYVEELDSVCCAAAALDGTDPWADFVEYIHGLVGYLATKQALAHELLEYVDRDAPLFQGCRALLYGSAEPLLARAQEAKVVRTDTDLSQVIQLIGGIAKIPAAAPEQIEHLVQIALDGLRHRD